MPSLERPITPPASNPELFQIPDVMLPAMQDFDPTDPPGPSPIEKWYVMANANQQAQFHETVASVDEEKAKNELVLINRFCRWYHCGIATAELLFRELTPIPHAFYFSPNPESRSDLEFLDSLDARVVLRMMYRYSAPVERTKIHTFARALSQERLAQPQNSDNNAS